MKVTITFIVFTLWFHGIQLNAQDFVLEAGIGVASVSANELIKLQDEIISAQPGLGLQKTDHFPSYPYIHFAIKKYDFKQNLFGIFWNYHTTGGRVAISDYSASVTSDQILNTNELGFLLEILLRDKEKYQFYINTHLSALFSRLILNDKVTIPDFESSSESLELSAINGAITPGIGLAITSFKMPVNFELNYLIQVTEFPFHLLDNRNAKLILNNNEQVSSGLTGIRIAIDIGLRL